MNIERLTAAILGLLILIPPATIAPPSSEALGFGFVVRAVQKATHELLEHSGSMIGRLARMMSLETTETMIIRATTRYSVQHLEDISEFFKGSPRLRPPTNQDDFTRLTIPRRVDLRHLANPIGDQGGEGTCTAFAIAGAMELAIAIKHARKVLLSARHIWSYYRRPSTFAAFRSLTGRWVVTSDVWPYDHRYPMQPFATRGASIRSEPSWIPLTESVEVLKVLAKNKPLIFATEVTKSFRNEFGYGTSHDGIIRFPAAPYAEPSLGGHAMTIIGYQLNDQFAGGGYFILRNSWGTEWGSRGYGYLPFAWCKRYRCAAYALDDVTWEEGTRTIVVSSHGAS